MNTNLKIGDRVKVTNENSSVYGFVGKIINKTANCRFITKLNSGERAWEFESNLQEVDPSMDTLLVGDILVSQNGDEAKVLEVGVTTFCMSYCDDFNSANRRRTFQEAKELGWKVKGQKGTKKMTAKQILEELKIEVVKE